MATDLHQSRVSSILGTSRKIREIGKAIAVLEEFQVDSVPLCKVRASQRVALENVVAIAIREAVSRTNDNAILVYQVSEIINAAR